MNKLSSNTRHGLLVATLAIGLATLAVQGAAREQSRIQPTQPKYFGDEYAQAQQALQDKPAAEMPQAF